MKRTKNTELARTIATLKQAAIEKQRPLWKRIATDLEKPSRQRRVVNLWKLDQYAKEGETIVVPGKVLGDGELTKQVVVAAHSFSSEAKKKLKSALTIEELLKKNPDGKGVRILG